LQYDIRHLLKAAHALNDDQPIVGEALLRKFLQGTYYEHILPTVEKRKDDHESFFVEQYEKAKDWFKKMLG